MAAYVSEIPIDAAAALKAFEAQADGAGGIVSFTGAVRPHSAAGAVRQLILQAYSPMTERGITDAVQRAKTQWPLIAATVHHRIGPMQPGETIVFVAAASAHRRAAFEAADFLMDYLKTEAVFWKQEITDTGEHWIEPRDEDYQDKARWAIKEAG